MKLFKYYVIGFKFMNNINLYIYDTYLLPYLNNTNHIYYINTYFHKLKKQKRLELSKLYSNYYINNFNFRNIINKYENVTLNIFDNYLPNFIFPNNIILVKLSYSNSNNLKSLKYVKNVILINCNNIINLNELENLTTITLTSCDNITNISSLSKCKQVILNTCKNITNIIPLHIVEQVFISYCHNIINFSALLNIKLLYILNCDGFNHNILIFNKIKKLYIYSCKNINNYERLI